MKRFYLDIYTNLILVTILILYIYHSLILYIKLNFVAPQVPYRFPYIFYNLSSYTIPVALFGEYYPSKCNIK